MSILLPVQRSEKVEQSRKRYSFMEGWKRNAGSGNSGDRSTPDTERSCRMMCRYSRLQTVCFPKSAHGVESGVKLFFFASTTSRVIFNFYGK